MDSMPRRARVSAPVTDAINGSGAVNSPVTAPAKASNSLHALAQAKGMMGFGSVIHLRDKGFVDIVLRDCGIVTVQAYWGGSAPIHRILNSIDLIA